MQTLPPEVSAPRISGSAAPNDDAAVEHRRRVAEVAYSLGLRRGFDGGAEQALYDWVEAEKIVNEREESAEKFRSSQLS